MDTLCKKVITRITSDSAIEICLMVVSDVHGLVSSFSTQPTAFLNVAQQSQWTVCQSGAAL